MNPLHRWIWLKLIIVLAQGSTQYLKLINKRRLKVKDVKAILKLALNAKFFDILI